MRRVLFIALLVMLFIPAFAQDEGDAIVGIWMNGEGTARIQIYKTKDGKYYNGRIVWLKEPNDPETGQPKLDKKNPNEAMRNKPIKGLVNLINLQYLGNKKWGGDEARIYDPKTGNTYTCDVAMVNENTLNLKGSIPGTGIGRTDTWTRQVKK